MFYLIKSDKSVIKSNEFSNAIINLNEIRSFKLFRDKSRYSIEILYKGDDLGWNGIFETEARVRAVLADILDHMHEDNMLAQNIDVEVVS